MHNNTIAKKMGLKKSMVGFLKSYNCSLLIALIVLCAIMAFLSPYFLTMNNFMNIGLAASVTGTMAAGLTVYMLMGALELSQYATSALCGTFLGVLMTNMGCNVWIAILGALLMSLLCGSVNAVLLTVGRIPPIIVTLGTMNVYRACAYILTEARNLPLTDPVLRFIGQGKIIGIPTSMVVMLLAFFIAWFVLKYTTFGRQVYAVGANPRAAHLSGINVDRTRFIGMLCAAFASGVAGILGVGQNMTAIPASGVGSEIDITTSVLVGGLGLTGGKGNIGGVFLGMMILMVINNGMTLLSIQSYYQQLVRGLVLLLAVLIDTVRGGGFK